jgi:hypothetical protein
MHVMTLECWLVLAVIGGLLTMRAVLPMLAVRLQLGNLLAGDSTTLAPASSANKIALIIAPFTPSENLLISNLTLASSGGLAPIDGVAGSQPVGQNPATLAQQIQIAPPAGGYRWLSAGATYPVNVYGYALTNNAGSTLLGVYAFPTAITLTADGQVVEVDPVYLTFVSQPLS